MALEEEVEDRVANLVSLLQARKSRLIEAARQTREARVRSLRDQVARCATHLQATTALLTFCIEALKETDSAAFLQIGGMLSVRAATAAGSWGGAEGVQEIARLPLLDLTLDDKPLRRAIDQLTFVQLKRESAVMGECGLHGRAMSVCEGRLNLPIRDPRLAMIVNKFYRTDGFGFPDSNYIALRRNEK